MNQEQAERLMAENERLTGDLFAAIKLIESWHNMGMQKAAADHAWQIYLTHAPEMAFARAALSGAPK